MEVDEFIRCILNKKPIEVGFSEDAYQTMKLVEKIYASDPKWQKNQSMIRQKA